MQFASGPDNDWLEIGKLDGRTSIGLGLHPRKLLEEATVPDVT
jgi:hypothetical protein